MRAKGKIASWNDDKGYGFIRPLGGGRELFVHVSAFANRNRRPEPNEVVTYSMSKDAQGRPCAANATLAGDKLVRKSARQPGRASIVFAVLFLAAMGTAAAMGRLSTSVLIAYVVVSIVAFAFYAFDKAAAKRGASRVSESALLMLGLAGGWPGALIAQQTLRHKSKKVSFRIALWFTVLVNCAALVWLQTADGATALRGL